VTADSLRDQINNLYGKYYTSELEADRVRMLNPGTQPGGTTGGGTEQAQPLNGNALRSVGTALKFDAAGRPIRNDYTSITDANGNLLSQFSMAGKIGDKVQLDQTGMNAIKDRALAQGP
jgi:hypothetical protein